MTVVRRSMLFTPANVRRFVEGVWKHSPDMVVLDLEDSVAPDEKQSAQAMVQDAIPLAARGGAEVAVRVNSDTVAEDCNAAIWSGLCAVVLPKAETQEQITTLDALLTRLEAERGLPSMSVEIMPMIESAIGRTGSAAGTSARAPRRSPRRRSSAPASRGITPRSSYSCAPARPMSPARRSRSTAASGLDDGCGYRGRKFGLYGAIAKYSLGAACALVAVL